MKNNFKISLFFSSLLIIVMPVHADIYFENITNQDINVKFKVCIEKDAKNKDALACKKYQDFEAGIAAGYRAKTSFDNIRVAEVNIKAGDKYGNNVLASKKDTCATEYKDKDMVLRLWLKDAKAAKQIVTCKAFEDKPADKADAEKK